MVLYHHLVEAKKKLKPEKHWTTTATPLERFNTTLLWVTNKHNDFKVALSNKFQAFHNLLETKITMGNNRKGIKKVIASTCQEVFQPQKAPP